MSENLSTIFRTILQKIEFPQKEVEAVLRSISRLTVQEQVLLVQLFQKFPNKIPAFWEVTKKKFAYLKSGVGDMNTILQEEVQLFK